MAQKQSTRKLPQRPKAQKNTPPTSSAGAAVQSTAPAAWPAWIEHPWLGWGGLIALLLLTIWIRAQHFEMPLERDEGEFGYIAQEILKGNWPYVNSYTQKLPGTYLVYALFVGLFGGEGTAIHLGLLLTNLLIVWLLFGLGRKLFDSLAGLVAGFCWTVMASAPNLMGFAGHATFFIALFALVGLWLLLEADEKPRVWRFMLAGLAFGLAFLMKQPAVFFTPFAIAWIGVQAFGLKRFGAIDFLKRSFALGIGSLIPFLLCLLGYAANGHFEAFWFWTFAFAREFVGQVSGEMAANNFSFNTNIVLQGFTLAWVLAGLGIVLSFFYVRNERHKYLIPLLALASFLTIVPGYYFTTHYFIAVLPAVALSIASLCHAALAFSLKLFRQWVLVAVPLVLVVFGMISGMREYRLYYFFKSDEMNHSQLAHAVYGSNPFPEAQAIGNYIAQNSQPADQVVVLGSEPQIYYYSGRQSATPSVVTYYMTAIHGRNTQMQQDMIRDIETKKPRFLVFVSIGTSWMFKPDSPTLITDWFNKNNSKYYRPIALAEILKTPEGHYISTIYKWGADEVDKHARQSSDFLVLFERLPGS